MIGWAKLKLWAAAAGAVLAGLLWGALRIRRGTAREIENRRLREAAEADRRMDDADLSRGDADDDRRWLRDRAERGRR